MAESSTAEAAEPNRLTSGYSGQILLIVVLCSATSSLGWFVIPPLLPRISESLAISPAQAGLGLTAMTGLSAVLRYPGGRLADKLSRKTVISFSTAAWTLGFLVVMASPNFPVFVLGLMLVGVGLGAYAPAAFAQLSDLFDAKQGSAFGLNNAAYNLGGILASGLAIAALALGGWRLAFVPVVVILALLLVAVHFRFDQEYVVRPVNLEILETVGRLAREPRIRSVLVVAALFSFVWNGSVSFFPTFLEVERGLSATWASIAFAALFGTGVVATPLSGAVGDRFGTLRTILATLLFATAGLAGVILAPTAVGLAAGVVVFAVGISGFWPVMTSYMINVFPAESKSGDYGAIGTVYMATGSLGPAYVGVTSEYLHFSGAFTGLVVCLLVTLLIVLRIYR